MFDIGWTELLVIGVVALIVVGPKDLPGMFRTLGRFTAKAKSMARDFSRAMEDAADEAGIKDVAKDLKDATSARKLGLDKIQDAASSFEKWDPLNKSSSSKNKSSSSKKKASGAKKGPATQALSEERAEMARKINEAGAWKATERKAAEAAREAGSATAKTAGAKKTTAKKTTAKKATAKTAAAKTAKKPAATKTAARKTTAKAPAAKAPKAAAKKPATKAAAPKAAKTAAKPAAKRKPATKGVSE